MSRSSQLARTSGFTIKTKLMASLSLLTLIILTLGLISFTSIVEINDLSVSIADRQSALAKVTEEIKTSVFRARDAEKDFLIAEEQEAQDRSGRFINRMRDQIVKASEIGLQIERDSGARVGDQFVRLGDAVDAYEQKFAEQVKNVNQAREVLNQAKRNTDKIQNELGNRASALRLMVKGITDDFWIETMGVTQAASDSAELAGEEAKQRAAEQKVVAERLTAELAAKALSKFERDADQAIVDATRLGTTQGTSTIGEKMAKSGNDLDSNAAAAVKNKAIEAQELLAEQNVKAAARVADESASAAASVLKKTLLENQKVIVAVNLGTSVADLDRELLNMQVLVARYLQEQKKSFSDAAIASVDTALSIADEIRRNTKDEKMVLNMGEVRKQLLEYQALFREGVADADLAEEQRISINADIAAQKEQLRQDGERLIELATALSESSWSAIATQSRELQMTGNNAQDLLMILVVVGVLLGAFVLYAVPRPILAAINQLLMAAQRVAGGDLTQPINVSSRDELGQLAGTFDHMRTNLMALVDRIQRASVQISTTVNEIQAASSQQSATSTEQAGALNEFSVTLREIAQSAEQLAANANTVASSSTSVADRVADANTRSTQMMESMNAIGESTRQTSDRIKALNDQMDTITDAVAAISGVADQTTLLSLNAAIEANKAGEMGKGFSVVATEIRRLSDRSIDSAGGIGGMVRDIQRATESSVVSMDKSSEEIRVGIELVKESTSTMQEVNLNMSEITSRTQEIAVGVNQQAVSSTEAQQTITELLSASNTASQAARQTSSAAYELNAMATQLSDAVAAFRT